MDDSKRCCWYGADKDNGWDFPPPHTAGAKATDVEMPPSLPTHNEIDYDDEDGG